MKQQLNKRTIEINIKAYFNVIATQKNTHAKRWYGFQPAGTYMDVT